MVARSLFLFALALAGCGAEADRPAERNAQASVNRAGVTQPVAAEPAIARLDALEAETNSANAAAPADPNGVTRAWFAGRWSDTGSCADAGAFDANGTYRLADGTRGMWNVVDGRLVVQNAAGRNVLPLRRIDDNTVEVVNEGGSAGRSVRC